ncbi:MAG: four helix bundle suffix domain-containing protein [Bacteroidaceae bacterium]|nr:four helix bundle suffix domain-containing protein [Bacteroidaceae bacterium]
MKNDINSGNSSQTGQTGHSGHSGYSKPRKIEVRHYDDGVASVLRKRVVYTELRFYQRSDVLYQLTQQFCQRFLPRYGDRTVDQMVQAARSTKQNIVEGSTDGQTSTKTELHLLGVARGSNHELLEDYQDYLKRKGLKEWRGSNPRFEGLHAFCRSHSRYEDYSQMLARMNDEELANMAICLCHQVDSALTKYIEMRDREFTTEGGITERMTAARLEQRATQKEIIERQAHEIEDLRREVARLRQEVARLNEAARNAG